MNKDEIARKFKWLVLRSGQAYSRQVTANSEVMILRELDGTWTVWRGKWTPGVAKPIDEKIRISRVTFERAIVVGNEYVNFFESLKRRRV